MSKLAILTDIHGCSKTLQALLKKLPPDADIVCLGDMIDRGPDSRGVIEWAMKNNIKCCLGNHEHMMIDYFQSLKTNESLYDDGIWFMNGGTDCMESFSGAVPAEVLSWMNRLPKYIIHPLFPHILLSHTGHGMFQNTMSAVWCRDWKFPKDKYFRIFGHTQDKEPVVTETYAMIDTGCAYKSRGLGVLTAMVLERNGDVFMPPKFIQQDNIE